MWEYNLHSDGVLGPFISFKVISSMVYDSHFLCPRYMQHNASLLYDRKEKVAKILIEFFNVRVTQ